MKRYVPAIESETAMPTGNVGIWWFYNDTVVGEYCPIDEGYVENGYIKFTTQMKSDLPEVDSGEVIYDIRSQVFEIICSQSIASAENAIKKIAEEFEIADQRYDVIPSSHYYVSSLTDKPVMNASQKRGYDSAIPYVKKYAKAMKVLSN